MNQNNRFAVYTALAMLQKRNNTYLCDVASPASACDVTCTDLAIGRETKNFTLFFCFSTSSIQNLLKRLYLFPDGFFPSC